MVNIFWIVEWLGGGEDDKVQLVCSVQYGVLREGYIWNLGFKVFIGIGIGLIWENIIIVFVESRVFGCGSDESCRYGIQDSYQ